MTVPDEAVEVVARQLWEHANVTGGDYTYAWETNAHILRRRARRALDAALPYIRAQIAREYLAIAESIREQRR